jgi:hypothetical protein
MFPTILLAAILGQVSGEWRPFPPNPRYEVFGNLDTQGVFRYTTYRLRGDPQPVVKAAPKPKNFGVDLEPSKLIEGSVRGTDPELARELAEKDRVFHEKERAAGDASGPCPRPDREPKPPVPDTPRGVDRELFLILAVAAGIGMVAAGLLAATVTTLVYAVRWLLRLFTPSEA